MSSDDLKFPKIETERTIRQTLFMSFLGILTAFSVVLSISLWQIAEEQKTEIEQLQNSVFKTQLKYEGAQNEARDLQKNVDVLERRLAEAALREKAARARASRSRSAGVARTSKQRVSASFGGRLYDITMYCPTGNTTASGKWPRRGMVATISRSIPFGTRVRIEGLGTYVVEDRIGHSSEFDIFTPSCSEAVRFGRQHRRVTILG